MARKHVVDGGWFNSVGEFADHAARSPHTERSPFNEDRTGSFHVEPDFPTAHNRAHTGWSAHRAKFQAAGQAFGEATETSGRFTTQFDVSGGWVDVDRFLQGEPECMVQPVLAIDKPVLRIGVDVSVVWSVNPADIAESGGTITGLVDVATASGYAVEIIGIISVGGSGDRNGVFRTFVTVKETSQPLDLDNVAFALAHADMFRRLWFATLDQHPMGNKYGAGSYYGFPGEGKDSNVTHPGTGEPFDILITDLSRPKQVMTQCLDEWKTITIDQRG